VHCEKSVDRFYFAIVFYSDQTRKFQAFSSCRAKKNAFSNPRVLNLTQNARTQTQVKLVSRSWVWF